MATAPSGVGHRAGPAVVEGCVEDLEPPVEQCLVEGVGVMEPAVGPDDLAGVSVLLIAGCLLGGGAELGDLRPKGAFVGPALGFVAYDCRDP